MYQTIDPTPWPPTRSDTSVPGITKERGKLPAMTGPPGPPGGAPGGGTCASWSIRRCNNSWLARRSPNSSALALGNAVINATAAVNPPSAATAALFRLLVTGPPAANSDVDTGTTDGFAALSFRGASATLHIRRYNKP